MRKQANSPEDAITMRLDAMLRLLIEFTRLSNHDFGYADAGKALYSVGLSTPEIAKILGWRSHGSVRNLRKTKKAKNDSISL